jgi:hypothetical protein
MVVVFPAPLGPSSPTISLRPTSNEMRSTATFPPYAFRKSFIDKTFFIAPLPAGPAHNIGNLGAHGNSFASHYVLCLRKLGWIPADSFAPGAQSHRA